MVLAKNIISILLGLIFSISLIFAISSYTLWKFTEESTLKPLVTNIVDENMAKTISNEEINQIYKYFKILCNGTDKIEQQIGNGSNIVNLSISCEAINHSEAGNISKVISEAIFNKIYYANLSCTYPSCFFKLKTLNFETLSIVISKKAMEFYKLTFWASSILTLISFIGIIIFGTSWTKITMSLGISMLVSSLPLIVVYLLKSKLSLFLNERFGNIIESITSTAYKGFWTFLILGLILVGISILAQNKMNVKKK